MGEFSTAFWIGVVGASAVVIAGAWFLVARGVRALREFDDGIPDEV
jgi:hypothetical protein